jgi:hypothetical protein
MKIKPWLVPLVLGGSLGAIYLLPKVGAVAQSAVNMTLPEEEGAWIFKSVPPSPDELSALSRDTKFSKALCFRARPGEFTSRGYRIYDRVDLSVVLSGADINNSIHRPERCMPAQGHAITSSSDQTLVLENGRQVPVKRLISMQSRKVSGEGERERYEKFNCVTYYFFIGHDNVTHSHLGRTLTDMKDRLVRGMDQRWAYVSASIGYGKVPGIESQEVSLEEADNTLRQFLGAFSERQIAWDQITR